MLSVTEDGKHGEDCCKKVSLILIYSLLFFSAYSGIRGENSNYRKGAL
jgi:hypothetical protein